MKKKRNVIVSIIVLLLITCAATYRLKDRTLKRPDYSLELPEGLDSTYISELNKHGVSNFKESILYRNIMQRRYWKENCGLNFLGENEMKDFLSDNNFILGDVDKYKKMIPVEAGKIMIQNIEKIKKFERPVYVLWRIGENAITLQKEDVIPEMSEGQTIDFVNYRDYPNGIITNDAVKKYNLSLDIYYNLRKEICITKILIVGSIKEFNIEGMDLIENVLTRPSPKDPIAVIKVQDGYVELVNWE